MRAEFRKLIKKVYADYLRISIKLRYLVIKKFGENPREFLLCETCKALEDNNYKYAYRTIPTNREKSVCEFRKCSNLHDCAVVIQGPLRLENNYTFDVIRYYRYMYPDILIILSTWIGEDAYTINEIRKLNVYVVLSEKPLFSGRLNVNLQLVSSLAGAKKAMELGANYICKTRTDQKLTRPYVFEFLVELIKQFPSTSSLQESRIIMLAMNYGNMFFPFFMCDFFYFGKTIDIIKLLSIPLDDRTPFDITLPITKKQYAEKMIAPEVYIMKSYFDSIGIKYDYTVKDYWECIKNYTICIDRAMLGLEWPKYSEKYSIHSYYGDFFLNDSNQALKTKNFDFVNWFSLYTGRLCYKEEYEKYADEEYK